MIHFKTEIGEIKGKKVLFLTELEWDWQTGNYVTYVYGWRRFELKSKSHFNNWIKKYQEEYVIDDIDNAINFFK